MKLSDTTKRGSLLYTIALYAIVLLFAKIFVTILLEYRWYFPPNFEAAAFLIGRRQVFAGLYCAAFYAHILSGPTALLLGSFLMISGGRRTLGRWHGWAGRFQVLLIVAIVAPSGLVMAYQTHTGPVAGLGFALLSIATTASAIVAALHARAGRMQTHRRWAVRCFILLCSPLLLRLASGWAIALGFESERFYTCNAWLSWLIPLAIYELSRKSPASNAAAVTFNNNLPITS